jgi:type IV secretion system protein VirB4
MYLDALLADQPLTGGLEPRLGRRICASSPSSVSDRDDARPARRAEPAGLSLSLVHARDPARQDRRDQAADQDPAAMVRQAQVDRRHPEGGDDQRASVLVDTDASNKAADADLALQELGADYAGIAYVTATVTVWDADPRIADEKLRLVEKVIQGRDFTAMAETINAVDAWLGSLPGHVYANVRQPPISTLNLAHMIPVGGVGRNGTSTSQPPLLFGKTEGSTPFRFSFMSAMSAIR